MSRTKGITDGIGVTRRGSGPPVVMIHGGAQGSAAGGLEQFAAQQPLAARGWELVLPDRPGHGRSPSRGPEDLAADAPWVAELLGAGAHLVGHSYGAAIALAAAGLRPEAVWSLTLIEAPIFSLLPDDPQVQALRQELASAIGKENPVEAMIAFSMTVRLPAEGMGPPPSPEQLVRMGEGLRQMRPPDSWDATGSIAAISAEGVPALLVTGGWSPGFEAVADELARRLHGERLTIEAGHHFPQLTRSSPSDEPGGPLNTALGHFLQGASDARTRRPAGG